MKNRIYLACPYRDKDLCKSLGARWDKDRKLWYITAAMDPEPFQQWWPNNDRGLEHYYLNERRIKELETTIEELTDEVNTIEVEDPDDYLFRPSAPDEATAELQQEINEWKSIKKDNPRWFSLFRPELDPTAIAFYTLSEESKSRLLN